MVFRLRFLLSSKPRHIKSAPRDVGFDWSDLKGVIDKFNEELIEMQSAENAEDYGKEIGDLLFSIVNLARWTGVDAESALARVQMPVSTVVSLILRTKSENKAVLSRI